MLLIAAPIALEVLRQVLGHRYGIDRLFFFPATSPGMLALTLLATTLTVAIPIKIWNSARIEHKLQEQEALLLEARIEALTSQINPHFLFNTLTSISSLIRTRPDTARMLINRLSGLLRRRLRAHDHFVVAARRADGRRRVPRHRVRALRALAACRQGSRSGDPGSGRAEHDPAAAGRELDQARPGRQARRASHHAAVAPAGCRHGARSDRQRHRHRRGPSGAVGAAAASAWPTSPNGCGSSTERRDGLPSPVSPGQGTQVRLEIPDLLLPGAADRVT